MFILITIGCGLKHWYFYISFLCVIELHFSPKPPKDVTLFVLVSSVVSLPQMMFKWKYLISGWWHQFRPASRCSQSRVSWRPLTRDWLWQCEWGQMRRDVALIASCTVLLPQRRSRDLLPKKGMKVIQWSHYLEKQDLLFWSNKSIETLLIFINW